MDNRQEAQIGMFLKVQLFFVKWALSLKDLTEVLAIKPKLETFVKQIFFYAGEGQADLSGIADEKAAKKMALVQKAILVASGVSAYAFKNKQSALFSKVNFTDSELKAGSGKNLIANVTLLLNAADPVKNSLAFSGVKASDVDELATLLTNYLPEEAAPDVAIDNRVQQNEKLDATIAEALQMLNEDLDIYMRPQSVINPDLYEKYLAARKIGAIPSGRTDPDATVNLKSKSIAVLLEISYDAERLFFITNDGDYAVEVSISDTATAVGKKSVTIGKGETRQRTSSNLAAAGNFLIAKNLGDGETKLRVWVED